jgi:hypothetical protein
MHLIEHITLTDAAVYYAIGALVWAFVMGFLGDRMDRYFFITLFVWPFAAASLVGQIIRRFVRSF